MDKDIYGYIAAQDATSQAICEKLQSILSAKLPDAKNKIWHAHPVWFLDDNPIVGYSKLKAGVQLMFWSGVDFNEPDLKPGTGKFKDASIMYQSVDEVDDEKLKQWVEKSRRIQWDYKNLIRNKGKLEKITPPTA